jgi:glycosidase
MRLNLDDVRMRCVSFVLLAVIALPTMPARAADGAGGRGGASQSRLLRDAVIYEVFPRAFSKGQFRGVTAQLDRLKDLGVTVVWLMPIHPVGS